MTAMNPRDALRSALAALPPREKECSRLVAPDLDKGEALFMPYVVTDPRITALFRSFNAGAFGIARRDRQYLKALRQRVGSAEALGPDQIAGLDEQTCLLLLRFYDRGERFCDGFQAEAHRRGVLHALLERLIEIAGKQGNLL
jgi:hypothetical protein